MSQFSNDYEFKIIVIGDVGSGKSSVVKRFCDQSFSNEEVGTVGVELATKTLKVGDKGVKLNIWDSSGQERFRTIIESFFRGTHGVVIVFDVSKKHQVDKWLEIIDRHVEKVPVIIMGNKKDLKEVNHEFIHAYFNVSAKTGIGIDEAFREIALLAIETLLQPPMYTIKLREDSPLHNYPKKRPCCQ